MLASTALGLLALAAPSFARTWQEQANITDPTEQCTWTEFPALDALRSTYPPNWDIANLNFTGVQPNVVALWNNISSGVPSNIQPRGQPNGDWTGVVYPPDDPDCWWTRGGCTTPKLAGLPLDQTTCNEPLTWGLTIDDGPNCSQNAYHDYLQSQNLKATLFYIGSNVENWPLQAQRGLGDGNELCVHTWSHQYMTALSNEQVFAELYYTKQIIKDVTGVTTRCWRPPYGDVDDRVRYIANALDLRTIIWDEDTDDWNWVNVGQAQIQANYESIIANASTEHGTVVLSHELNDGTMNLSMQFLPQIKQKFTGGVMPIGVCSNNTNPYVEQEYTYPNYDQWTKGTTLISGLPAPTAISTPVSLILSATATATPSTAPASSSASPTSAAGAGTVLAQSRSSTSPSASAKTSAKASDKPKSGAGRADVSVGMMAMAAVVVVAFAV